MHARFARIHLGVAAQYSVCLSSPPSLTIQAMVLLFALQASLQSALSRMLTEQEASPVSPHEWEGECRTRLQAGCAGTWRGMPWFRCAALLGTCTAWRHLAGEARLLTALFAPD